jgi:hypothetical protein
MASKNIPAGESLRDFAASVTARYARIAREVARRVSRTGQARYRTRDGAVVTLACDAATSALVATVQDRAGVAVGRVSFGSREPERAAARFLVEMSVENLG